MNPRNGSRRKRGLIFTFLLVILATLMLAGFAGVLASGSALLSTGYLPIILREAGSPGTGTSTPAATRTATPTRTSTPPPGEGKVLIVDMAFLPAEITVHVGEQVEWENQDTVSHTTTSDTGVWDSGELAPDEKFSFVFDSVGDFPYHCSFHPGMTGVVHVIPNP